LQQYAQQQASLQNAYIQQQSQQQASLQNAYAQIQSQHQSQASQNQLPNTCQSQGNVWYNNNCISQSDYCKIQGKKWTNGACRVNNYCTQNSDCSSDNYCILASNTCAPKRGYNLTCVHAYECITGNCHNNCVYPYGTQQLGATCTIDNECDSGSCSVYLTAGDRDSSQWGVCERYSRDD